METTDRTDRFQLELYSKINPLAQSYEAVARIVESIVANAAEFAPDLVSAGKAPPEILPCRIGTSSLQAKIERKTLSNVDSKFTPGSVLHLVVFGRNCTHRIHLFYDDAVCLLYGEGENKRLVQRQLCQL